MAIQEYRTALTQRLEKSNLFLVGHFEITVTGNIIKEFSHFALKTGIVEKGDLAVITAGDPGGYEQTTNMIEVVRI